MLLHEIQSIIPQLIRRLRLEKNLSQEELAQLAGLDRTYISIIERGARNISLKTLAKVLCALNIDTQSFAMELLFEAKLAFHK